MKKLITFSVTGFLILIFICLSENTYSYPRFAAYSGNMCIDCHVNPTGGGMRNGGGLKFAEKKLSMEMFSKIAGKTKFSPKLTKDISIGGDVRVAQVDNEVSEGVSNYNSFLAMQGDLYFNVKLNKILNVYATSGIQIPNIETEYEVFGMISNLPANTYFKVGRFRPAYGTRIVEHRAYQRSLLLYTPYDANTGFELGINPDWFDMNIGLYNVSRPNYNEFTGSDPHKMFIGNTNVNFAFKKFDFNFNMGGSFLNDPYNVRDSTFTETITKLKQAYGVNTRLGFLNRIALLGEVNFEENKSDFPLRRSFYGFGELDFVIIKGLELRTQYEIYDVDRDISGDDIQRISAGFAAYPFFGFETEVMVRFVTEDPDVKNNEFQWNFHFYF
ncbi:MAG TPA: hypothetical protein PKD83_09760 [Ignavibacteria bacterium]|nr:hypothetical protein [Ignavibacteria bacterium]